MDVIGLDTAPPPITLLGFGPAWGAPSADAACTKAHAWMRICGLKEGIDFAVQHCNNPSVALGGELPVLRLPAGPHGARLAEPAELYDALAALGHDPDARLSELERADSAAYTALIEERLGAALLHALWEDEANYDAVIRPTFSSMLPAPLCFYAPWSMRRRVHSLLARRRLLGEGAAHAAGVSALRALAARLGQRPFFHGSAPSGLDATAYAFLATVLRCPLPSDALRRSLRELPALVAFCERIEDGFIGSEGGSGRAPLLEAAAAARPPAPPRTAEELEAALRKEDARAAAAAGAGAPPEQPKPKRTSAQERQRTRSRNTLLGAAFSALVYVLATDSSGDAGAEEQQEQEE